MKQAMICCRTATRSQHTKQQLKQQAKQCQTFADEQGFQVLDVINDVASGNATKRAGMDALLNALKQHPDRKISVIIEDISRLARDWTVHHTLQQALQAQGAELVVASPAEHSTHNLFTSLTNPTSNKGVCL